MSIESIADQLHLFSIFGGIEAQQLSDLADLFESQSYAAGTEVIGEGSFGNRLYIIVEGQVSVSMEIAAGAGPEPSQLTLAQLGTGDTFGEMELIDTQQRSATVTALEPTRTLEITNMGLLAIFERAPDSFRMLMMNLARDLSRRLRAADRRLAELMVAIGSAQQPAGGEIDC